MTNFTIDSYLKNLSNQINFYYPIMIVPIGIILNVMTMVMYCSEKRLKTISGTRTDLIHLALGVCDIFALLNSLLFVQFLPTIRINLTDATDASCKLTNLWRKFAIQSPSWMQVLVTLDRFRSVVCPKRMLFFRNRCQLSCVIMGIFLMIILVNMGQLWGYTSPSNSTTKLFHSTCTSSDLVGLVTDVINVLFRLFIPFWLMLIMNIFLVRSIFASKSRLAFASSVRASNRGQQRRASTRSNRREINYMLTVIGLNWIFFVLNIPWATWYIMSHLAQTDAALRTPFASSLLTLLLAIAHCMFYLTNLSSFVLNMVFNRVFRRRVLLVVTQQISTATIDTIQTKKNINFS